MSKKYKVNDINDDEIIIERTSKFLEFKNNYGKNIFVIVVMLAIILFGLGLYFSLANFEELSEPLYKDLDLEFNSEDDIVVNDNTNTNTNTNTNIINKDNANEILEQVKNNNLLNSGEVLVINIINKQDLIIYYFSDGTALMKRDNNIFRIASRKDGSYGVNDEGVIYPDAYFRTIYIIDSKNYSYGKAEYYSDGSAILKTNNLIILVRDSKDINDNYISDSDVSFIKNKKTIGNYRVVYYLNGAISISGNNKEYLLYKEEDFLIDEDDIIFKYNNEAELLEVKKYDNGEEIKYYSDGSAIIKKDKENIFIKKSSHININNNKFVDIKDNNYVKVTNIKQTLNAKIYYYNNGSAIIRYNNNEQLYIPNNEDIRYQNNTIIEIDGDCIKLSEIKEKNNNTIYYFDNIVYIKTNDDKEIICDKNLIDDSGSIIKEIDKKIGTYTLTNNSKKTINYRVVIEQSDNTTIDSSFVNYSLDINDNVTSGIINDNIWEIGSKLSNNKKIEKTSYILYEGVLEPLSYASINLLLYYNYENMTNDMMDKWFKGTFKIYGWEE